MNNFDLLNRIEENYIKLSKGQKRIADYIFKNYDKVAFMTAASLGEAVGVSESTVVRFANALGYDGYPKLLKGLQESIKTKLTTVQRFELSKHVEEGDNYLKKIMSYDIDNIRRTIEGLDVDEMEAVVEEIHKAKNIYILGLRSSAVLANYLGFYMNFMFDNVKVAQAGAYDVFDHFLNISEDDLLIVISFPRYSKKTFEVVEFVKSQGAKIVGITDSKLSPLAPLVQYCLTAKYNMNTFIDSLVPPMSLINSLIIALSMKNPQIVEEKLSKLETIWDKYNIYNPK